MRNFVQTREKRKEKEKRKKEEKKAIKIVQKKGGIIFFTWSKEESLSSKFCLLSPAE